MPAIVPAMLGEDYTLCMACKRLRKIGQYFKLPEPKGWSCDAFPDEIPPGLVSMESDHREKFPGDNGLIFDPDDGYEQLIADFEEDN